MKAKTQAEAVLLELREMILRGHFAPGTHLMEIPLSQQLNVSRTPVRWALGTLAQEGLLVAMPQRGFVVRGYTTKEIVDAVDVRGQLEGMACRLVAEIGLDSQDEELLEQNLVETRSLMTKTPFTPLEVQTWCELNATFHGAIARASRNDTLTKFLTQIESIPLAGPIAIIATANQLERVVAVVQRAVLMHGLVFDALRKRQPDRADSLMREHVHQGRDVLEARLEELAGQPPDALASPVRLVSTPATSISSARRRRRSN